MLLLMALVAILALAGAHFAVAQAKKDKRKPKDSTQAPPTGKVIFQVYKDRGGKYRFRLKHGDKTLAISGVGFKDKADCQKVIASIRREATRATVEDKSTK
jgi:uncharacterized protein YegP (UPF0339 family)